MQAHAQLKHSQQNDLGDLLIFSVPGDVGTTHAELQALAKKHSVPIDLLPSKPTPQLAYSRATQGRRKISQRGEQKQVLSYRRTDKQSGKIIKDTYSGGTIQTTNIAANIRLDDGVKFDLVAPHDVGVRTLIEEISHDYHIGKTQHTHKDVLNLIMTFKGYLHALNMRRGGGVIYVPWPRRSEMQNCAALLRALGVNVTIINVAADNLDPSEVQGRFEAAIEHDVEVMQRHPARQARHTQRVLKDRIDVFEKAFGVSLETCRAQVGFA